MSNIPKGYKQTEVGVIPEEWEVKRLGEVCTPSKSRINPILVNDSYKCVELEHLSQETGRLLGYVDSKNQLSLKAIFQERDVLFGKLRPYLKKFLFAEFEGVCSTEIWVLKPAQEIENKWLFYLIQTSKVLDAANQSTGTKMPRAEWDTVGNVSIPLPPTKAEQTAIATALSDADALISSLEKLIAKKRNIKKGAMQQLLTGKKRLPSFSGEWEVMELGKIFTFLNTANNSREDLMESGEIGYIHYGDIHTKWSYFLDCSKNYIPYIKKEKVKDIPFLENGDLVVADASEDYEGIGVCVEIKNIGERNVVAGLHTLLLRGNKSIVTDGFKGYLREIEGVKDALIRIATGISVYGISKNNLKNVKVKIPSIKEQAAIAQVLSDMDAEIEALEKKLEKYKMIKQGMMQELLTGKTRLI